MSKFDEIVKIVDSAKEDAKKFYESGNKSAGTRLRKACLELKKLALETRKEVTETKGTESEK